MILFLSGSALAAPTHAAMDAASWSVVTTANHADAGEVTISTATVAGVQCFRGTATTDQPAEKLLAVVTDVAGSTRWSSAGITEAKLLSNSGGTYSYYQYLDVPGWTMASDRYWFLVSKVVRTGDRIDFLWDPMPTDSPFAAQHQQFATAHPDAVEPPVNIGSWSFVTSGAKTQVIYQICTQPGGSLPVAIQNAATRKTLPDTVGDVIKDAKKR
jgi:hypothetical protein